MDPLPSPTHIEHPFKGETVLFATKHGKEHIIAPLLHAIGIECMKAEIDTDQFGTFSGEVERTGSVRETLRKKIQTAAQTYPNTRLILASEGSFGPHPILGFIPTDLESLLLWDRKNNLEIYAEHLHTNPVHAEQALGPSEDFREALKHLGFPDHGVIVHPENSLTPIFKGLHNEYDVAQAMLECFASSTKAKVILTSDLRANHNPTRRLAILQAGQVLLEKLNTFCPACSYPGFAIKRGVPGLLCLACGEPSQAPKAVLLACVACDYTEEKERPDGQQGLNPDECEFCNP